MENNLNTACDFHIDITARRGDTFSVDLFIEDDEGNPVDLTGMEFKCNLMDVELTLPNKLTLNQSAEEMANRKIGIVNYNIWQIRDSEIVKTIVSGIFNTVIDYKK